MAYWTFKTQVIMPHTRKELLSWAKDVWEKIKGKQQQQEEVTIKGWLARDENGWLFFYKEKPNKGSWEWHARGVDDLHAVQREIDTLPIAWSDEEPTPCEVIYKIKK